MKDEGPRLARWTQPVSGNKVAGSRLWGATVSTSSPAGVGAMQPMSYAQCYKSAQGPTEADEGDMHTARGRWTKRIFGYGFERVKVTDACPYALIGGRRSGRSQHLYRTRCGRMPSGQEAQSDDRISTSPGAPCPFATKGFSRRLDFAIVVRSNPPLVLVSCSRALSPPRGERG